MIITSLLCGTKYSPSYARILRAAVQRNVTVPYQFRLIVDRRNKGALDDPEEEIELPGHGIEGWWNKVWLFSDEFTEHVGKGSRIAWLDLDTVLIGSIDFLSSYKGDFAALRDFCGRRLLGTEKPSRGTGVMLFPAGRHLHVWRDFTWPDSTKGLHGDQEWINLKVESIDVLQNIYPHICSFKMNCRPPARRPPEGARIICFHGKPDPHEMLKTEKIEWLEKNWREG